MFRYIRTIITAVMWSFALLASMGTAAHKTERPEFAQYFQQFGVTGACVVYNSADDAFVYYNAEQCKQQRLPASTFKIPNSLIALETGVVDDENTVIAWDSVARSIPAWNADTDLRNAFANSTVWYYQELARRIGNERMREYVEKFHYGNKDISGGIDRFWLAGGLRISPEEQVQFLRQLYSGALPVSKRTLGIVKRILVRERAEDYTLSGKTGWTTANATNIGWFVGYVERDGNTWFYATLIEASTADDRFAQARIDITKSILRELGVLP